MVLKHKVIILDRDGIINELICNPIHRKYNDTGFGAPFPVEDFHILPGVREAIASLQKKGYLLIIISNQPGIAQGHHKKESLDAMNGIMRTELGIPPENIFYCMHNITSICPCRKPKPGLIHEAAKKFHFDPKDAILIGDSWKDVAAGRAAGCRKIILIGQSTEELGKHNLIAEYCCPTLADSINYL